MIGIIDERNMGYDLWAFKQCVTGITGRQEVVLCREIKNNSVQCFKLSQKK
jgi:hypothetical protein